MLVVLGSQNSLCPFTGNSTLYLLSFYLPLGRMCDTGPASCRFFPQAIAVGSYVSRWPRIVQLESQTELITLLMLSVAPSQQPDSRLWPRNPFTFQLLQTFDICTCWESKICEQCGLLMDGFKGFLVFGEPCAPMWTLWKACQLWIPWYWTSLETPSTSLSKDFPYTLSIWCLFFAAQGEEAGKMSCLGECLINAAQSRLESWAPTSLGTTQVCGPCKGTRPVLSQSLEIQEPDVQGWSLEFTTIIILALQQWRTCCGWIARAFDR